MTAIRLLVTGMTCGHRRQTAEEALQNVRGGYAVFVDLQGMTAEVVYDDSRSYVEDLTAAVERSGYHAAEAA